MSSIRVLTEQVAAKIAAGEIIERPASVVRELMDNSIDARADRVEVRIQGGGKTLVRVSDNGRGMDRDDLLLCVERHATSKIREAADLLALRTLGFRGEALPSIAAISKVEITSRPADQLIGHKLSIRGGRLHAIDETGAPPGTIIQVRDLFYNIPARRKFLRTPRTETEHATETFSRIALPFKGIHFKLTDGERTLLNLPASEGLRNRLAVLFGREVAASLIEAEGGPDGMDLRAHLAPPEYARSRGDRVLIYVNGRNVRDRLLIRAVMEGYGQRLMKGRYPQAVVFIEMDPARMDVNVHPTKQEVRFQRASEIYQTVVDTLSRALGKGVPAPRSPTAFTGGEAGREVPVPVPFAPEKRAPYAAGQTPCTPDQTPYTAARQDPFPRVEEEGPAREETLVRDRPHVIGQLLSTYILCQSRDGLLIVDQHAAHERIVYEKLKAACETSAVESQFFLIPDHLELSVADGAVLRKNTEILERLGFQVEPFGGNTFLVRSVPSMLVDMDWRGFLGEILPVLRDEAPGDPGEIMDRVLISMACHGAIRAGKQMSRREMEVLLEQLDQTALPSNCPHGRPVFKTIGYGDMEKMFRRVL